MSQTVVSRGVHVLDVLVRPVEAIPEGQGGQLVEQIRATAAGTAGGTSPSPSRWSRMAGSWWRWPTPPTSSRSTTSAS